MRVIIVAVLFTAAIAVIATACGQQSDGDTSALQPPSAAATASASPTTSGAPRVAQAEATAAVAPPPRAAQPQASASASTAPSSPAPPASPVATHNDAAPSAAAMNTVILPRSDADVRRLGINITGGLPPYDVGASDTFLFTVNDDLWEAFEGLDPDGGGGLHRQVGLGRGSTKLHARPRHDDPA